MSDRPAPPPALIPSDLLTQRVVQLGAEIRQRLPPGPVTAICVLKGAFVFFADLVRHIERPMQCDFLGVRSYGDATESSGVVEIVTDLSLPIAGRHVLLVEDIVDTGLTLRYLLDILEARHPASIHVAALLSKPVRRKLQVPVDFVGFDVPDRFVVGYGLDAAQEHRNLPYIAALD